MQTFQTRRSLAHGLISSVLKNETVIETPEDVNGILELCHVLIRDQTDGTGMLLGSQAIPKEQRRGVYHPDREEMAEEQGWVARMVHLFRAESLDVQFEVMLAELLSVDRFLIRRAIAPTNRPEAFRDRWRPDALYLSCPDHRIR